MKIYSEILKKCYDTVEECLQAEQAVNEELEAKRIAKEKATAARKARAEEIEQARAEYLAAREKYNSLLSNFCKDFGAYHCSIKPSESFKDFIDFLNLC